MARIRVRARAVDMLGRQQIAGIPTAIHELFKNAHDAYAKRVEVDFFREDQLLILRDNGHGMTREDFEDRWLTLGTESKVGANDGESPYPKLFDVPRRPVMGEKGIGRLAIAAIGPQVLVVTRAVGEDGLSSTTACLVNWGLFEIPGLDLDEIEVPIMDIPGDGYPDKKDVGKLIKGVEKNLKKLGDRIPREYCERFEADLKHADFDPAAFIDYLKTNMDEGNVSPDLRGDNGHGTHFFILPTYPSLEDDIDEEEADLATPLKRNLLGFSNTMMPKEDEPPLTALFRDHLRDDRVEELIAEDNFFLPEEFLAADHHFDGEFDEFGQFKGTVQFYGEPPIPYTLPWEEAGGQKTECGPFKIHFAYVQGKADETRMPYDEWVRLSKKLDLIGGLYIYRNGIRVLPYGNSDYDFLHIERRRTKAAKDWFFSYRRMFGAVEISHDQNPALHEKAGREGFRTNTAYRQFREILENLFIRLAVDFFRTSAERGEEYRRIKEEFQERSRLLKKKSDMAREKKKKFVADLEAYFDKIEHGEPVKRAEELRQEFLGRLEAINNISDPGVAGDELLKLEKDFIGAVSELEKSYTVTRPRGVGMTKRLTSDWQAYQKNADRLDEKVYMPLRAEIGEVITETLESGKAAIDRRRRLDDLAKDSMTKHEKDAKRLWNDASSSLTVLNTSVKETLGGSLRRLSDGLSTLMAELQSTNVSDMSDAGFERYRTNMLGRIDDLAEPEKKKLERLRTQLEVVAEAVREGESIVEMADAAEDETQFVRGELATYTEFAQTGMSLGIIQHEFGSTVRAVRKAISNLKPWADGTPELGKIHKALRASFEHLDGYLTLFTPLSRRLYRSAIDLTGEEIRKYLSEVFGDRLERHEIKLEATDKFDAFTLKCYPSTYLPVFINLVDNAIHWITFDRDSDRWIKLDADKKGFIISNGGPGIDAKDADRIFEFGETNKIGGRGMGLFISRQSLKREGWDVSLEAVGRDRNPKFRIAPVEEDKNEEDEVDE